MDNAAADVSRQALPLVPGDQVMGLSVYQIDRPHQPTLIQSAQAAAAPSGLAAGIQGYAIALLRCGVGFLRQ